MNRRHCMVIGILCTAVLLGAVSTGNAQVEPKSTFLGRIKSFFSGAAKTAQKAPETPPAPSLATTALPPADQKEEALFAKEVRNALRGGGDVDDLLLKRYSGAKIARIADLAKDQPIEGVLILEADRPSAVLDIENNQKVLSIDGKKLRFQEGSDLILVAREGPTVISMGPAAAAEARETLKADERFSRRKERLPRRIDPMKDESARPQKGTMISADQIESLKKVMLTSPNCGYSVQPNIPPHKSFDSISDYCKTTIFASDGGSLTDLGICSVRLYGGDGTDSLKTAISDAVHFYGGNGDDSLHASIADNVVFYGDEGNDTAEISINDFGWFYMGSGNDSLDNGLGEKVYANGGAGDDFMDLDANEFIVYGGTGNDHIEMYTYQGMGNIEGSDGNDYIDIHSYNGTSHIRGGPGNDQIIGDVDRVCIWGENGDDSISAYEGAQNSWNYIDGGEGNDRLFTHGYTHVIGGPGHDFVDAFPDAAAYWLKDGEIDLYAYWFADPPVTLVKDDIDIDVD